MFELESFLRGELSDLIDTERGEAYEDKLKAYWDQVNECEDLDAIRYLTEFVRLDLLAVLYCFADIDALEQAEGEQMQVEIALDRLAMERGRTLKQQIWS